MKVSDKIFLLPVIILAINFLYRLKDFSEIIFRFPLDVTNDLTAYIADIPFFDIYGFFGHVPLWYNGFTLFNIYPPGWVLFTYPLYKILEDIMLATFVSTLLLFFIGFFISWFFGKELKLSIVKRIALFTFIYANPITVGAILKQGRIPSLMALDLLLLFFFLCIYFKEKPINWKAISLPLVYASLILTHQTETILASAFLLGLFFVKDKSEKKTLVLYMFLSLIISSFWTLHFLQATIETGFLELNYGKWILDWNSYFWNNLAGAILSLGFFLFFYLSYKIKKEKSWIIFFLPTLILISLYLTRIVIFIPILKNIYPDPWVDFITINIMVLFFSLQFTKIPKKWKIILALGMIIIASISVIYNHVHTPYMNPWTEHGEEAIALIPYLNTNSHFLMFNEDSDGTLYSRALYSYAAIYYNISSASGWFEVNKEYNYLNSLNTVYVDFYKTGNCKNLKILTDDFNTTQLLANGKYCQWISNCEWKILKENGDTCLLNAP